MTMVLSRRHLLACAGAAAAAPALAQVAVKPRTRLVVLGTKGGPTPSQGRAPAAYAVESGRNLIVMDAPDGVARQLVRAGFDLSNLAAICVSHLHSDHMAGLGALLQLAWGTGLKTKVHVYGPRAIKEVVAGFLAAAGPDIAFRVAEEGRPPLAGLVQVHEVDQGSEFSVGEIRARCAQGNHYSVPNIIYRLDGPDRSIVVSGDTAPSPRLIELARDADVLVHEVMLLSAIDRLTDGNAPTLRDHLVKSHTTTDQLGEVARDARVRLLVLSHLVPAFASISDEQWVAGVRASYRGPVVVARDLMEL